MKLIYLLPLTLLIACDKPDCTNKNPVFDKNAPGSMTYDTELVKQMTEQAAADQHFWIEGYKEKDGKEYMQVELQAKDMCAHFEMDITGNGDLEQFRKVKGMSYSGAGLAGLKLKIANNDTSYSFFFERVQTIVD